VSDARVLPSQGSLGGLAEGRLLSGGELNTALNSGRVFVDGSWDRKRVKGAGYELTLADDWVACPKPGGAEGMRVAKPGGDPISDFVLKPGETAIVASKEKFCLDFDISCLIGPKFRWAAEGLQLLHGAVAHPGYGMHKDPDTDVWSKKADERLYLVVINIGPRDIFLQSGKPIAYVQFFQVEKIVPADDIENVGFATLADRFMGPDSQGIRYYRAVRDLSDQMAVTVKRLDVVEALVDRANTVIQLVVVFGVFLVTATLLGAVYTNVVDAVKSIPASATESQVVTVRWLTLGFGGLIVVALLGVIFAVVKSLPSNGPKPPKPTKPPKPPKPPKPSPGSVVAEGSAGGLAPDDSKSPDSLKAADAPPA
jgi:deoxycytidine triphosphate deaminase